MEAAFTVLTEGGYDALTIEGVARLAGTGKTTIYRWWSSKAELAVEAFFEATEEELRFPDLGSAERDFRAQIMALAKLLQGKRGRALAAMLGGARNDPTLATALGEKWLKPRRVWGMQRMKKAAESWELQPNVTAEPALALLYGPLYTPLLFNGDVPSEPQVQAYLDLACRGIFRRR